MIRAMKLRTVSTFILFPIKVDKTHLFKKKTKTKTNRKELL